MSQNKFEFNEHGVCVNPETVCFINPGKSSYQIRIVICERDGLWFYGYSFYEGIKGISSTCDTEPKELLGHDSKDKVITQAVSEIRMRLKRVGDHSSPLKKEFDKWATEFKTPQNSLF